MPSPFAFRCLLVIGLCVGASAACGSSSDTSATTTSVAADTSTSSTTSTTAADNSSTTTSFVEDASTSIPVVDDAITVAVYWNRPYGTARPIDIPGYTDPADGPYPYVLFGSVTNVGAHAIAQPQLTVDWYLDGRSIHTATVPVRDPQGGTLAALDAGASADVIVVVDSESDAVQLPDAQPTFGLYAP